MTSPNHIVGGLAITGIIGSLSGINILEEESYIALTVVASLLPDIDHTKSPMGKLFYPLAKSINRRFGHRTITHTLAALLIGWALVGTIGKVYFDSASYGTIFLIAYLSHLLLDMLTVQGVPLFYPFMKNPCVIPGDPSLRLRSSDIRSELTAFCIFCAMFVFFKPLMATGFWTQYNQFFGTMKHLYSEFQKSEDLLEVEYWGRVGSQSVQGRGYVIEAKEGKATIIENGAFRILDKNSMVIEKVLPTHTGKRFFFDTQHFIGISIDSLNQLLEEQYLYQIEVHANAPFHAYAHGQEQAASTQYKGELLNSLYFREADQELPERETYVSVSNTQIPILRDKLERMQQAKQQSEAEAATYTRQLSQLKAATQNESDLVKRELLYEQLKELENGRVGDQDYEAQISELEIRIRELLKLDALKNQEGRRVVAKKNSRINRVEVRVTGMYKIVEHE